MNEDKVLQSLKMENSWNRAEYISKFGSDEEILNEILGINANCERFHKLKGK